MNNQTLLARLDALGLTVTVYTAPTDHLEPLFAPLDWHPLRHAPYCEVEP